MRYAIISDIHANQQAWESVSKDIDKVGVDQVICLGDIVGYGPAPVRVLESVYDKSSHFVLGNHDAVIGGQLDPECFHDEARIIIEWTRTNLNQFAVDFFQGDSVTREIQQASVAPTPFDERPDHREDDYRENGQWKCVAAWHLGFTPPAPN